LEKHIYLSIAICGNSRHLPKRKYGSMSRSRLFTRTNISRTTVQPAKISILSA